MKENVSYVSSESEIFPKLPIHRWLRSWHFFIPSSFHCPQLRLISNPFAVISCPFSKWQLITCCCYVCLGLLSCGEKVVSPKDSIIIPEKEVAKDAIVLHANEGLFYYLEQPFSGFSVHYYPNGILAEKVSFFAGKKEGRYQKWYPDGTLSFEATYQKGRKGGVSKTWWKNGQLRSASTHVMGVANGNQKQWYQSGQLFKSMHIVDGKEEGLQQAWRENGKIYNNYEAKNGRIFGLKRASLCYELEEEIVQVSIK